MEQQNKLKGEGVSGVPGEGARSSPLQGPPVQLAGGPPGSSGRLPCPRHSPSSCMFTGTRARRHLEGLALEILWESFYRSSLDKLKRLEGFICPNFLRQKPLR